MAQIGNHTVKSGSTLQSLTALSVGEAKFYAMVKRGQVGLSLRRVYQDLGIPMKIEIRSGSSTANSLTDRLGAGQRTKHIDTRYFWVQERVQEGDLSIKQVPTAKIMQMLERSQSLLQYYNNVANLQDLYSIDNGSHTPPQMCRGITQYLLKRGDVGSAEQTIVVTGCEHRDGCKG